MSTFYPLTVSQIQTLTPNAVAITFAIGEENRNAFQFKAGQYITIKKEISGTELRRSYSISSAPENMEITIGVKRVDGGGFSDFANNNLKEGDVLEVSAPEGRFIFDSSEKRDVIAFAAGSGITPIMSIARTVLNNHPESRFVLIYGNQNRSETMFYDELQELQKEYTDRFIMQMVYSRSREDDALFGRIDTSVVNFALKNKFKEYEFDNYYLCGPESMINVVRNVLDKKGISSEKVFFELFTSSTDEQEQNTMIEEGKTRLTIILDDEEQQIVMDRKQTVLDAVLKADIDAPYSCQGGICSTCIARISNGEAIMEKNQILTDGEIADGFVLTCQAHPTTPELTVDYDDV
ncbi:ferredoxin--NADP reductase [Lentiprolixibacter aurantiacus]|uniref:Ferredoxin--NADP reductase n=1 Tax=Lentiprolixibacter aurantiacus TaxID=2993939 RepID=A0AAE3MJH0_9FLAO|nr:ferredoxin--NADP reductase [Lentiprolixibacter aurantiacus]MCX2718564.1 ferredoxin--NADP reductase [Lentiprolixibacter aurantiacus]